MLLVLITEFFCTLTYVALYKGSHFRFSYIPLYILRCGSFSFYICFLISYFIIYQFLQLLCFMGDIRDVSASSPSIRSSFSPLDDVDGLSNPGTSFIFETHCKDTQTHTNQTMKPQKDNEIRKFISVQ